MSVLQQDVEILRKVPLFASCDPMRLKLLAFTAQRLRFQKDQWLFRQNDFAESAYVILSGNAAVSVLAGDADLVVATVTKNDFVGEIGILCNVPRTASVQALSELDTLVISKSQLFDILHDFPDVAIAMLRVVAERLVHTNNELARVKKDAQTA